MSGTPNTIYIVNLIRVARLSQQNAESHFRHQRLRTRRVLSRMYCTTVYSTVHSSKSKAHSLSPFLINSAGLSRSSRNNPADSTRFFYRVKYASLRKWLKLQRPLFLPIPVISRPLLMLQATHGHRHLKHGNA